MKQVLATKTAHRVDFEKKPCKQDILRFYKEQRKLVLQQLIKKTRRSKHHKKWCILLANKWIDCNDANYDVYN